MYYLSQFNVYVHRITACIQRVRIYHGVRAYHLPQSRVHLRSPSSTMGFLWFSKPEPTLWERFCEWVDESQDTILKVMGGTLIVWATVRSPFHVKISYIADSENEGALHSEYESFTLNFMSTDLTRHVKSESAVNAHVEHSRQVCRIQK